MSEGEGALGWIAQEQPKAWGDSSGVDLGREERPSEVHKRPAADITGLEAWIQDAAAHRGSALAGGQRAEAEAAPEAPDPHEVGLPRCDGGQYDRALESTRVVIAVDGVQRVAGAVKDLDRRVVARPTGGQGEADS